MNFLESILFTEIKVATKMEAGLKTIAYSLIALSFLAATIWEFATNLDFKGVLKRTLFAFLLIAYSKPYLSQMKELGMMHSGSIIKRHSVKTNFYKAWKSSMRKSKYHFKSDTKGDFLATVFKGLAKGSTFLVTGLMYALNYFALLVIGILYSLIFHGTYVLAPIIAVISILPIASKASMSIIQAGLWLYLVPVLSAVLIACLGEIIDPSDVKEGFLYHDVTSYVQLLVMSAMMFLVAMMARKIVSGDGLHSVAESAAAGIGISTFSAGASTMFKSLLGKNTFLGSRLGSASKNFKNNAENKLEHGKSLAREGAKAALKVGEYKAPYSKKSQVEMYMKGAPSKGELIKDNAKERVGASSEGERRQASRGVGVRSPRSSTNKAQNVQANNYLSGGGGGGGSEKKNNRSEDKRSVNSQKAQSKVVPKNATLKKGVSAHAKSRRPQGRIVDSSPTVTKREPIRTKLSESARAKRGKNHEN